MVCNNAHENLPSSCRSNGHYTSNVFAKFFLRFPNGLSLQIGLLQSSSDIELVYMIQNTIVYNNRIKKYLNYT